MRVPGQGTRDKCELLLLLLILMLVPLLPSLSSVEASYTGLKVFLLPGLFTFLGASTSVPLTQAAHLSLKGTQGYSEAVASKQPSQGLS